MPGTTCVAYGCGSTYKSEGVSLHYFPVKNPTLMKQWNDFVKVNRSDWEGPKKFSKLCSKHFTSDDFQQKYRFLMSVIQYKRYQLNKDAVPTVQHPDLSNAAALQKILSVSYRKMRMKMTRREINDENTNTSMVTRSRAKKSQTVNLSECNKKTSMKKVTALEVKAKKRKKAECLAPKKPILTKSPKKKVTVTKIRSKKKKKSEDSPTQEKSKCESKEPMEEPLQTYECTPNGPIKTELPEADLETSQITKLSCNVDQPCTNESDEIFLDHSNVLDSTLVVNKQIKMKLCDQDILQTQNVRNDEGGLYVNESHDISTNESDVSEFLFDRPIKIEPPDLEQSQIIEYTTDLCSAHTSEMHDISAEAFQNSYTLPPFDRIDDMSVCSETGPEEYDINRCPGEIGKPSCEQIKISSENIGNIFISEVLSSVDIIEEGTWCTCISFRDKDIDIMFKCYVINNCDFTLQELKGPWIKSKNSTRHVPSVCGTKYLIYDSDIDKLFFCLECEKCQLPATPNCITAEKLDTTMLHVTAYCTCSKKISSWIWYIQKCES